jgi:hypothetical protein
MPNKVSERASFLNYRQAFDVPNSPVDNLFISIDVNEKYSAKLRLFPTCTEILFSKL